MLDGSLVSTAYDVRVRARIVSTGAISAWSTTTQTTSSTSVTLAGPTAVQVASDGQGTYRVTAVVGGTPLPLLDADSASETGVGSDTYRTPESIRRGTPDAYGLAMVSASAPNDGLRRRLRVRAVSGAGVSNWVTASPDVTPYTVQQITPAGTAAITSTSLFRDVSPFNIYIDGFTVSDQ